MNKKLKIIGTFLKWTFILTLLPLIISFVLCLQISEIRKNKNEFHLTEGIVDIRGFTEKTHKGKSMRSFRTNTKVFYIKLHDNDTLYSYYFKNSRDYNMLFINIKDKDFVRIYNKGFEDTQNTVDIVQLESNNRVLIDKNLYNKRIFSIVILLSTVLFLYFAFPIFLIYKSKQNNQKKHIR